MSYTDSQMVIASQIAYMDFDIDIQDDRPYTVMELLEIQKQASEGEDYNNIQSLIDRINETPGCQECGKWIIKDICNDQHGSGMYACMIDTCDGNAMIAFRGSESDTWENKVKDWGLSDIGLLNNILTPQQAAAEKYTRKLYERYGDQYNGFGVTGHSLGGNLAEHATITASDSMRDKIFQCVNLDGPGYSETYMIAHAKDIQKSKGLIIHYQWSLVGTLLTPVPGSNYQTVSANTPEKSNLLSSLAWRHETTNVQYDENGNFISGNKDYLAAAASSLSKAIDYSIFQIFGVPEIALIYNTLDMLKDGFQDLWSYWEEIRYSTREIQFEVNTAILSNGSEELTGCSDRLAHISSEVDRIQRQLAFNSISAGYVKLKLWSIANSIGSDGKKLQVYGKSGAECGRNYRNAEQNIINGY